MVGEGWYASCFQQPDSIWANRQCLSAFPKAPNHGCISSKVASSIRSSRMANLRRPSKRGPWLVREAFPSSLLLTVCKAGALVP